MKIYKKEIDLIIVDDRDNWRKIIVEIIRPLGYSFIEIDNFGDAVNYIISNKFKLAILDLNMDDGDEKKREGLSLLNLMDEKEVEGKAIIITGFGWDEDKKKAEQSPRLVDFIYKKDLDFKVLQQLVIHNVE